jgi:hypothetical protein
MQWTSSAATTSPSMDSIFWPQISTAFCQIDNRPCQFSLSNVSVEAWTAFDLLKEKQQQAGVGYEWLCILYSHKFQNIILELYFTKKNSAQSNLLRTCHHYLHLWLLQASSHRTCIMTCTWCCMYSLRLLMMDGETVWNMYSVVPK